MFTCKLWLRYSRERAFQNYIVGQLSYTQHRSYPVYVDTSVIMGQTAEMDQDKKQYKNIVYMPCNPSNDFFPDLENTPRADVVYFCSPNNPTGAAATKDQLYVFPKSGS